MNSHSTRHPLRPPDFPPPQSHQLVRSSSTETSDKSRRNSYMTSIAEVSRFNPSVSRGFVDRWPDFQSHSHHTSEYLDSFRHTSITPKSSSYWRHSTIPERKSTMRYSRAWRPLAPSVPLPTVYLHNPSHQPPIPPDSCSAFFDTATPSISTPLCNNLFPNPSSRQVAPFLDRCHHSGSEEQVFRALRRAVLESITNDVTENSPRLTRTQMLVTADSRHVSSKDSDSSPSQQRKVSLASHSDRRLYEEIVISPSRFRNGGHRHGKHSPPSHSEEDQSQWVYTTDLSPGSNHGGKIHPRTPKPESKILRAETPSDQLSQQRQQISPQHEMTRMLLNMIQESKNSAKRKPQRHMTTQSKSQVVPEQKSPVMTGHFSSPTDQRCHSTGIKQSASSSAGHVETMDQATRGHTKVLPSRLVDIDPCAFTFISTMPNSHQTARVSVRRPSSESSRNGYGRPTGFNEQPVSLLHLKESYSIFPPSVKDQRDEGRVSKPRHPDRRKREEGNRSSDSVSEFLYPNLQHSSGQFSSTKLVPGPSQSHFLSRLQAQKCSPRLSSSQFNIKQQTPNDVKILSTKPCRPFSHSDFEEMEHPQASVPTSARKTLQSGFSLQPDDVSLQTSSSGDPSTHSKSSTDRGPPGIGDICKLQEAEDLYLSELVGLEKRPAYSTTSAVCSLTTPLIGSALNSFKTLPKSHHRPSQLMCSSFGTSVAPITPDQLQRAAAGDQSTLKRFARSRMISRNQFMSKGERDQILKSTLAQVAKTNGKTGCARTFLSQSCSFTQQFRSNNPSKHKPGSHPPLVCENLLSGGARESRPPNETSTLLSSVATGGLSEVTSNNIKKFGKTSYATVRQPRSLINYHEGQVHSAPSEHGNSPNAESDLGVLKGVEAEVNDCKERSTVPSTLLEMIQIYCDDVQTPSDFKRIMAVSLIEDEDGKRRLERMTLRYIELLYGWFLDLYDVEWHLPEYPPKRYSNLRQFGTSKDDVLIKLFYFMTMIDLLDSRSDESVVKLMFVQQHGPRLFQQVMRDVSLMWDENQWTQGPPGITLSIWLLSQVDSCVKGRRLLSRFLEVLPWPVSSILAALWILSKSVAQRFDTHLDDGCKAMSLSEMVKMVLTSLDDCHETDPTNCYWCASLCPGDCLINQSAVTLPFRRPHDLKHQQLHWPQKLQFDELFKLLKSVFLPLSEREVDCNEVHENIVG